MIETRPKVSIIIPVYNSAKHLRECLDSVVHQTLNDIEIIVVYDKSEDDSWDILLEYASFESVRIIESVTKQGPGGARNIGIASASADYLGFCDSDDIVEPTMFEKMYKQAVEADADMVVVKTSRFTDNPTNPIKVSQWPDKLTKLSVAQTLDDNGRGLLMVLPLGGGCFGVDYIDEIFLKATKFLFQQQ